ncbi:MAG: transposase, partial [Endomicrobiia bacterium]|nr:transposase [Endomicrobiia bacterium]
MKFRKDVRLQSYNYKTNGYYFVTICADYRKPLLTGHHIKSIVVAELARLGDLKGVSIDYCVLMPDHIHVIIVLYESDYSLSEILRRFKSKTTILANKSVKQDGQRQKIADQGRQLQKTVAQGCRLKRLWQPNYYEHIIR